MALLALLVAVLLDPIRIVAVLLCVAFVCKTYPPGRRFMATAVSIALVAALIIFIAETMHTIPASALELTVRYVAGVIANGIIAGIAFGIIRLVSGRPQQHR